jgi:hypothetical protein
MVVSEKPRFATSFLGDSTLSVSLIAACDCLDTFVVKSLDERTPDPRTVHH